MQYDADNKYSAYTGQDPSSATTVYGVMSYLSVDSSTWYAGQWSKGAPNGYGMGLTQASSKATFQFYAGYWADGKFSSTKEGGEITTETGSKKYVSTIKQTIIIPSYVKPTKAK